MDVKLRDQFLKKWKTYFGRPDGQGVTAPFGSGCSSIVYYPWFENEQDDPKAVLGTFMDESFLTTTSWQSVKKRL